MGKKMSSFGRENNQNQKIVLLRKKFLLSILGFAFEMQLKID